MKKIGCLTRFFVGIVVTMFAVFLLRGAIETFHPFATIQEFVRSLQTGEEMKPVFTEEKGKQVVNEAVDKTKENLKQKGEIAKKVGLSYWELAKKKVQEEWKQFNGFNYKQTLPKTTLIPVDFLRDIDGDTAAFSLNNNEVTVRFVNVDTPECVKPNTPVQPFSKEAKEFTTNKLKQAQKIEIMLDNGERIDKFERILAYVFVDGENLNLELVQNGFAKVANIQKESNYYLSELYKAEAEAKAKKLRIWEK